MYSWADYVDCTAVRMYICTSHCTNVRWTNVSLKVMDKIDSRVLLLIHWNCMDWPCVNRTKLFTRAHTPHTHTHTHMACEALSCETLVCEVLACEGWACEELFYFCFCFFVREFKHWIYLNLLWIKWLFLINWHYQLYNEIFRYILNCVEY